ncbi:MAG: hypothetical protein IJX63_11870 [Lachnospiraceae bacterium]|nr:hypothetical protein [Lachnospiraceae bacterium]
MEEMDKLLEDLQKVTVEFNNQLSKYEKLMFQTGKTNEKLEKYTESNRDKVDRLCIRVEKKLGEFNQQIEAITEECKGLFTQYSTEISTLNAQERAAFSQMLMEGLNQYKNEFLQDVLGDYRKILQVFMDKIQKESEAVRDGQTDIAALVKSTENTNAELVTQIHGLRVIVNGCLEAINHTVSGINDSYMTIFGEFSKQVNSVNKEDRERFIGELSKVLDTYKADYGLYKEILQENKRVNQELSNLTLKNTENVQAMEQQISKRLNQTQKLMEHISIAYEKGFNDFAKDVSVLNSRERENLIVAVRSMIEDYRFTFGKEIESKGKEMNTLFQNTLVGVCNTFGNKYKEYQQILENTKLSNAELHDNLQGTLMEIEGLAMSLMRREDHIKAALDYMKDDYRGSISRYVQELEQSNVRNREQMTQMAVQNLNQLTERFLMQLEQFKNERSSYKQQIETLLEEERKDREDMLNRQAELINLLKMEQEASKRKIEEKQQEMNRYQMVMSTVSTALMLVCILLLIPWDNTSFLAWVGVPVVVVIGLVITIFRKRIASCIKKTMNQRKKD